MSARRTGAGRPPSEGGSSETELTIHRGIRWRRDPDGTIGWYNDGAGGWLRWRPGADAPPPPPGWEKAVGAPPPRLRRASWRSPYRLVPVALAVAVVVAGVLQAAGGGGASVRSARAKAEASLGRCLLRNAGSHGPSPSYSATPVGCSTPGAALRVVRVIPAGPHTPSCAAGQVTVALSYGGITPALECAVALGHARSGAGASPAGG